ncbi:MAG: hypothetical protein JHC71_08900, partial [Blastococcus sp.]|nr:hypothetical protein [Blastococcus sp.]
MSHEPEIPDDDATDELGRHRVSLTPERPTADRLPLSQILRGEPRPPRTRLRRGSGLAGAALVGAAVVLSGAWAVQNVVVPESTEDPQSKGLWVPPPRVPAKSVAARTTTKAAPVSAPGTSPAAIGASSGSGSSGSSGSGSSG